MTSSPPDLGAGAPPPPPTGVVLLDVGAPPPLDDAAGVASTVAARVRSALQTAGVRCLVLVVDGAVEGWADDVVLAVADASVPVVALLRGHVTGHAAAVALAADLRVADVTGTLHVEPLVGGTSATLPRVVGEASARLLLLAPRTLQAAEAHAFRLVHELHRTPAQALVAALELATAVAEQAGLGAAVRRALTPVGAARDVETALAEEARLRAVVELHRPR